MRMIVENSLVSMVFFVTYTLLYFDVIYFGNYTNIIPKWLDIPDLFNTSALKNKESHKTMNQLQNMLNESLKEKEIIESILCEMLPSNIANKLSKGNVIKPEKHEFVCLFMSDIESFTPFASNLDPLEVFKMLNRLYRVMDFCLTFFPTLYKLETVGDGFVVVGGINGNEVNNEFAYRNKIMSEMIEFSMLINEISKTIPMTNIHNVKLRIGLHCGSVVGGITGIKHPRFCLFGDAMNFTSRLESTGETGKIHISKDFLDNIGKYLECPSDIISYTKREPIDIKGKGIMQTYWIESINIQSFNSKYSNEIELSKQIAEIDSDYYIPNIIDLISSIKQSSSEEVM